MKRADVASGLKALLAIVAFCVVWALFMQTALYRALNELARLALYLPALFVVFIFGLVAYGAVVEWIKKFRGK